jgi:hypothetical protein
MNGGLSVATSWSELAGLNPRPPERNSPRRHMASRLALRFVAGWRYQGAMHCTDGTDGEVVLESTRCSTWRT